MVGREVRGFLRYAARGCPYPVAGRLLRIRFGTADAGQFDPRLAWLRAARAPSPDVRCGPPGLRSLGCRLHFAILASFGVIRRLQGTGSPSLSSSHASRRWAWSGQWEPIGREAADSPVMEATSSTCGGPGDPVRPTRRVVLVSFPPATAGGRMTSSPSCSRGGRPCSRGPCRCRRCRCHSSSRRRHRPEPLPRCTS